MNVSLACPICQQPMMLRKQDKSYSTKDQTKHYDRSFFVCQADDVWMRVEIPQVSVPVELVS